MDRKYLGKRFNELLVIGIPDLLMKSLYFHGFMKNMNSTAILICPSRMLGYYFYKGFVMLERNSNNLKIIDNEAKQRIHAINMHDSYYVMNCTTTILYISNKLKKLLLQSYLHLSYIQIKYNGK